MNDTEKLVELVMSSGQVSGFARGLANYLIENGVTIKKEGTWVASSQNGVAVWRCSNDGCLRVIPFGVSPDDINYCPYCGAKMTT